MWFNPKNSETRANSFFAKFYEQEGESTSNIYYIQHLSSANTDIAHSSNIVYAYNLAYHKVKIGSHKIVSMSMYVKSNE